MNTERKEIEKDSNELLTKIEAQKILKVGHNTMLELLKTRQFSFKIGNKWFCNKKLMFEWMDKQVLCK